MFVNDTSNPADSTQLDLGGDLEVVIELVPVEQHYVSHLVLTRVVDPEEEVTVRRECDSRLLQLDFYLNGVSEIQLSTGFMNLDTDAEILAIRTCCLTLGMQLV